MSTEKKQELTLGPPSEQVPMVVPETNILSLIARIASDPLADIDKLERLMQMQERSVAREAENEFNRALSAAQSEIGRIGTTKRNEQTKSDYAEYWAIDAIIRPVIAKHGFSLSFDTEPNPSPDIVVVLCHMAHRGGHTRTYRVEMPCDGKGAQGASVMTRTHATGAAFTYGQRYLVKMIFNLAVAKDNDGNQPQAASEEQEAKADEFLQAIAEAETVAALKTNVGATVSASGLPSRLMSRVRSAYTVRLNKLREAESKK